MIGLLLSALALVLNPPPRDVLAQPLRGIMNAACTLNVTPADDLHRLVKELPEGAVLCLAPGVYPVRLWIEKSITIRGAGPDHVIIDAEKERPAISIENNGDAVVTIEALTLRNGRGSASQGGGLNVGRSRTVTVRNVRFEGGNGEPGGAAKIAEGHAVFNHCVMTGNKGKLATALFVYNAASAELHQCLIADNVGRAPAVTASWQGKITLDRCTILQADGAALRAVGTGVQAPTIVAQGCILSGPPVEILRGGFPQPKVILEHNLLAAKPAGDGLVEKDNVIDAPALDADHRPLAGSASEGFGHGGN